MADRMHPDDPAWPAFEDRLRYGQAIIAAEIQTRRAEIEALERVGAAFSRHLGEGKDLGRLVADGHIAAADAKLWLQMIEELRASGKLDEIIGSAEDPE